MSEGGLELRRQRCRAVVKAPNRLVSSDPGTPPLPIDVGKSGPIQGVWWNGGGTGTYSSVNSCAIRSVRSTSHWTSHGKMNVKAASIPGMSLATARNSLSPWACFFF